MAGIEIRNTENTIIVKEVVDGGIDSSSLSINLFGRGTENYLSELNTNFYKLMENFASKKAPTNPIKGQLWFSIKGSHTIEAFGTGLNKNGSRYIKIDGVNRIKNSRGLALVIIDNSYFTTGKYKAQINYDVYGSDSARTQLANRLAQLNDDEIFILSSYDAVGTNAALNNAMKKLNSKSWHKINGNGRYPYAAIGSGKCGIIAENLQHFDAKKDASCSINFESSLILEGFGSHCAMQDDVLLVWDGNAWISNATALDNLSLADTRSYVLSGVDLSKKYAVNGKETINGSISISGTLTPVKDIIPSGNEIQDIGSSKSKFKKLYLSDFATLYMGEAQQFNKNSFVYTVNAETDSIKDIPNGSLIINRSTGEAIIKKTNATITQLNTTFKTLSFDRKNAVVVGGNNYSFFGNRGVFMGSWNHNKIQYITITTPGNAQEFGTCRAGGHSAGASDGTRGLSFWQHPYGGIEYITISSPSNALGFGTINSGNNGAGASDGETAVVFGGSSAPRESKYLKFTTPMNAVKFGNIESCHWNGAASDGVRAVFDSGAANITANSYQYIVFSTLGNSLKFGNMASSRGYTSATSNGIYGLWVGGHINGTSVSAIEKITIGTLSNGSAFGNLSYIRHTPTPVSNDNTMVAAGGSNYSVILDSISYANGGSAAKFGESLVGIRYAAAFSGN